MQGEIEKTDEEIVLAPESPPKKRRRVKKPDDGAEKAPTEPAKRKKKRPRADEAEDADQVAEKGKHTVSSAAPGSAPSGVRLCRMAWF